MEERTAATTSPPSDGSVTDSSPLVPSGNAPSPAPTPPDFARLTDEWKANVDLQKFHETLKQQRLTHFLTTQLAMFTAVGLLATVAVRERSPALLIAAGGVALLPWRLASLFLPMDRRARAYIDVVKGRLLKLEAVMVRIDPSSAFATYTEQFDILVRNNQQRLDEYIDLRKVPGADPLRELAAVKAAHRHEEGAIGAFAGLWRIAAPLTILVGLVWALVWPFVGR
jgi:hypothetical protein